MNRILAVVQTVLAAFAAFVAAPAALAQNPSNTDITRVTDVPREAIDSWLKEEVKKSGGDWNKDRYALYVGFSTAGWSNDPVPAIAMRRLAFSLMNNSLAVGDQLTPFSYEMNVDNVGNPVKLTSDPATRGQFVNEVPYTAKPGSAGGHDIEHALYQILQKIPKETGGCSIVLLLNKDNTSQDPQGLSIPLFGEKNPQLLQEMKEDGFLPTLERKTFQMKSDTGSVTVAVTALFPKELVSLPGTFGERYPTFAPETWQPASDRPAAAEKLPNLTTPGTGTPTPVPRATPGPAPPVQVEHRPFPWWILIVLALIAAAVIVFMVMGKRSGVQRPLQPAAAAAPVQRLDTIPGSLRVLIGPDEQTLAPLPKNGTWTLSRHTDGSVKLVDTAKPPGAPATQPPPTASAAPSTITTTPTTSTAAATTTAPTDIGTPLAKLYFGEDRVLNADADSGAQFAEIQGTAAERSDNRSLKIEPGKRVLCRVQQADASSKTRFEIVYETQAAKGAKG